MPQSPYTVCLVSPGSREWEQLSEYAFDCSWHAGKVFAQKLRGHDLHPYDRVFALMKNGWQISGYCALCREDAIPDCMYAPWCSFVFVGEEHRLQGCLGLLLSACIQEARTQGFETVYVCTDHSGLYEKYGFRKMESRMSIYGSLQSIYARGTRY